MSGRSMLRWPAMATLVLAVAACEHAPFSPIWGRGTYDLVYANNQPVPSTVYTSSVVGQVSRVDVIGGSLTLRGDDSYQLIVTARETRATGSTVVTYPYAGRYDYDSRTLFLNYFDPVAGVYSEIDASWRDGSIELVLPDVAAGRGVLLRFYQ